VPPVNAAVPALPTVILRSGNVVKSIVDAAVEYDVDCHSACNIDPLSRGIGVQNLTVRGEFIA